MFKNYLKRGGRSNLAAMAAPQEEVAAPMMGNRGYGSFRIRPDLAGMMNFAYNRNQTPQPMQQSQSAYQLPTDLPQQQEFQGLYSNPNFLRFMQMYRGGR